MSDGRRNVVVLDRIRPGWTPPYCVHGKATCIRCREWVYLGSETVGPVASRAIDPICMECAVEVFPRGAERAGHLVDHLRADGPHG